MPFDRRFEELERGCAEVARGLRELRRMLVEVEQAWRARHYERISPILKLPGLFLVNGIG